MKRTVMREAINEIKIKPVHPEEVYCTIADYFCDFPDKAKKFENQYAQGLKEGLGLEQMLLLFVGGELANDNEIET